MSGKNSKKTDILYEQSEKDAIWLKIRCPHCGCVFFRRKWSVKSNKSGLYFCSRRCATVYLDKNLSTDKRNVICEFHASEQLMDKVMNDRSLEVDDDGMVRVRSY